MRFEYDIPCACVSLLCTALSSAWRVGWVVGSPDSARKSTQKKQFLRPERRQRGLRAKVLAWAMERARGSLWRRRGARDAQMRPPHRSSAARALPVAQMYTSAKNASRWHVLLPGLQMGGREGLGRPGCAQCSLELARRRGAGGCWLGGWELYQRFACTKCHKMTAVVHSSACVCPCTSVLSV